MSEFAWWFVHVCGALTLLLTGFGVGWIWCDCEHDLREIRRSQQAILR